MTNEIEQEGAPDRHMLVFTRDLPNLMTLAGLCCGMLAIYFASFQSYPAAMIALLWAAFFDWFDGPVAKLMKGRSNAFMTFGTQLDSLADLVSAGVAPAFILLSVDRITLHFWRAHSTWCVPVLFGLPTSISTG